VDNGIERRIVVLPFNRTIPEEERIPDIGDKIAQNEGHIVIALAIRAAEELLNNGVYTIPRNCNAATQQWFRDVDPVSEWLEDNGLERYVTTAGITIRELYSKFNSEMRELGIYHIPSARRFKQRLRSEVDQEEKWVIVRRNVGEMIFPKDLFNSVSKVTKFP
jgi:phage/plasmid-associated DNA primase